MHTKFLKIILSTLITTLVLVTTVDARERVINFEHWKTQNGTRVFYSYVPEIPIIDIKMAFAAGSAFDGQQFGVANVVGDMLFEGAGDLSADQIAKKMDDVGANYGVSVSRDASILSLRSLNDKEVFQQAFDTFKLALTQPTFPEKSLKRIKSQIFASLAHQQQSPKSVATKAFFKKVFSGTPYAHPVDGNRESVTAMTQNDLRQFKAHYYTAKNSVLVIVGDVKKAQAKKIATELTQNLPAGQAASLPSIDVQEQNNQSEHIDFPALQSTVRIGQIGVSRTDPDYITLELGNYILGGGLVSRLSTEVREKRGLSYSVYSSFYPLRNKGPFLIALQTKNSQTDKAIEVARKTFLRFITIGPNKKELKAAKQHLTGSFPLRFDSNKDIASNLLTLGFYRLPFDYYDTYRAKINAITHNQIVKAFQAHVDPEKMFTIVVGKPLQQKNG